MAFNAQAPTNQAPPKPKKTWQELLQLLTEQIPLPTPAFPAPGVVTSPGGAPALLQNPLPQAPASILPSGFAPAAPGAMAPPLPSLPEPQVPDFARIAQRTREQLPVTDLHPALQQLIGQYREAAQVPPPALAPWMVALLALLGPKGAGLQSLAAIGQGMAQGQETQRQRQMDQAGLIPSQMQALLRQQGVEENRQDIAVQGAMQQAQSAYDRALVEHDRREQQAQMALAKMEQANREATENERKTVEGAYDTWQRQYRERLNYGPLSKGELTAMIQSGQTQIARLGRVQSSLVPYAQDLVGEFQSALPTAPEESLKEMQIRQGMETAKANQKRAQQLLQQGERRLKLTEENLALSVKRFGLERWVRQHWVQFQQASTARSQAALALARKRFDQSLNQSQKGLTPYQQLMARQQFSTRIQQEINRINAEINTRKLAMTDQNFGVPTHDQEALQSQIDALSAQIPPLVAMQSAAESQSIAEGAKPVPGLPIMPPTVSRSGVGALSPAPPQLIQPGNTGRQRTKALIQELTPRPKTKPAVKKPVEKQYRVR